MATLYKHDKKADILSEEHGSVCCNLCYIEKQGVAEF